VLESLLQHRVKNKVLESQLQHRVKNKVLESQLPWAYLGGLRIQTPLNEFFTVEKPKL